MGRHGFLIFISLIVGGWMASSFYKWNPFEPEVAILKGVVAFFITWGFFALVTKD
jgi:hypothetical protein